MVSVKLVDWQTVEHACHYCFDKKKFDGKSPLYTKKM